MFKHLRSLLLMSLFALTFISCAKTVNVQNVGLFTIKNNDNFRITASSPKRNKQIFNFQNFQDSKQILVFCKLNSKHISTCYADQFEKALSSYKKKKGPITASELQAIKAAYNFQKVLIEFEITDKAIMNHAELKIESFVNKRVSFCQKNATKKMNRCLTQYLNRDTFAITNNLQRENSVMNGQEYIYIKKKIQSRFEQRLAEERVKMNRARSTSSL